MRCSAKFFDCSDHTNMSIWGTYTTTWSQQKPGSPVCGLNAVYGSINAHVSPPSRESAAYQLPVKKTTFPFRATEGSFTYEYAGPAGRTRALRTTSIAVV